MIYPAGENTRTHKHAHTYQAKYNEKEQKWLFLTFFHNFGLDESHKKSSATPHKCILICVYKIIIAANQGNRRQPCCLGHCEAGLMAAHRACIHYLAFFFANRCPLCAAKSCAQLMSSAIQVRSVRADSITDCANQATIVIDDVIV